MNLCVCRNKGEREEKELCLVSECRNGVWVIVVMNKTEFVCELQREFGGRRGAEIVLERNRGKRREGTTMVAVHGCF